MSQELQLRQDAATQIAVVSETAGTAVAAQAKAQVEARYVMAYRNPRNEDEVRQRLLKECKRSSFANVALYYKPIGGKKMEGLSIRFAEGALRCMKNIDIQSPTIYDDPVKRIVRVSVTDLEANLCYSSDIMIEKTVERSQLRDGQTAISSRLNSYGKVVHLIEAGEDELLVKQAALVSKAIRTLGLRIIPGDLLDECKYIIRQTMQATDFQDPDAAKRRIFDSFNEIGVTVTHLQAWLGHEGASLTPKEMEELRGTYQAIRDGETTWRDVMEQKSGSGDEPVKPVAGQKLKDAVRANDKPKTTPQTEPADEPLTTARLVDLLNGASDQAGLDAAWEIGQSNGLTDDPSITKLYGERLKAIKK